MRIIIILAIVSFFAEGAWAQQPNLINRLVTTVRHDTLDINQIVFTDAETGEATKFFLPTGFRPASLVAMDRNGDVWIDSLDSFLLYRISGVDGSVQAIVNPGNRATYIVTDAQANLVVGHANTLTGLQAKVFVDRYNSAGTYIDGVDLTTLFPPGVFLPLAALWQLPTAFVGGVARILITRSGSLWVGVLNAGYHPVLRLNPNLTLDGSYGLYPPKAMVPDEGEGVWVHHISGMVSQQYPVGPSVMPGVGLLGWAHLSANGQILDLNDDGVGAGVGSTHSIGHRRYDGRQFQYPNPGGTYSPGQIRVGRPENQSSPNVWFPYADRIDYSLVGPTFYGYHYGYMSGFFLDGAQRVWALRNSFSGSAPPAYSLKLWTRFPVDPPYAPTSLSIDIGQTCLHTPGFPTTWYWSTYWGNASLFEYVHYTDPDGDLDGDGVSNRVELANFSNPLLPYGFSPAATATSSGGAPGTTFTVNYSVPGDQGLAYAAPFALAPAVASVGGGLFLPVPLTDPLVQLSLNPVATGLTGTLGVLDSQGAATATLQIPPEPWLSGYALFSCIVTRDPNLPLFLKTVSPPFQFTIP
jgi:hypothetical protein